MPRLTILVQGKPHVLSFRPGASLREILDRSDYRVRSACLGHGACGLCQVRLLSGEGGPHQPAEQFQLSASDLTEGKRLACQMRPTTDLTVEILNPQPPSGWRTPPEGLTYAPAGFAADRPPPPGVSHPVGAAVDLGTTHLSIAVHSLASGRRLAERWGKNPQGRFGSDVVTRLMAAQRPEVAEAQAFAARHAIGEAIADVARREGLDCRAFSRVTVVGNTAMLALLANRNHHLLLQPAYWMAPLECTAIDGAAWAQAWGIASQAQIELVLPLGGFVGSDLIAGLVACRLTEGQAPALFIDFGTNSEIALWTGRELWVTATAGGPAFESGAGSCGTPAEAGAVFRVTEAADGGLAFRVLDDDCARGLCGSGLVDLVACLRRNRRLDAKGKFAEGAKSFTFAVGEREFSLGLRDIDALQRAKAAVGAGIAALTAVAGLPLAALQRVVVAGLFGRYLDVANAQAIGLLPAVPASRIELVGNTAAAGATALLLSTQAQTMADRLRQQARLINLAHRPEFEDAFLEHLYLRPTEAN